MENLDLNRLNGLMSWIEIVWVRMDLWDDIKKMDLWVTRNQTNRN